MSGLVEAFIIVAAVAIVVQMGILLAMFIQMRAAIENFTRIANDFHARVNPILTRISRILDDSEDRIASIMSDASEITRVARSQAQKVDRVFTDAVERLRLQVVRADHILTGTLEVIEEAGSQFRSKVWGPVQKASAILRGLKVGLDYLRGMQRKKQPEAAPQDEELFI
jgi:hypothetical protein